MSQQTFQAMQRSIIDGAPDIAARLARESLTNGIAILDSINIGYVPGMQFVGEQFAKKNVFLPDMMASAEAMRAAMAVLEPELKRLGSERPMAGTVVLGTTRGDIHEIGKALVGTLLTSHGFRVIDLGVDVAGETFASRAREAGADIVGVSALLTTTMRNQGEVIQALEKEGLRPKVKVIVGGAPVTQHWANEIGADGYAKDAVSSVLLVRRLMSQKGALAEQ